MESTNTFEPRVEDRLEIQDAVYRWCRGVDRRDWDLVRSIFHADAHDDHGVFSGSREEMIEWLQERHAEITQSLHHAGNIIIDFAGSHRAIVETSILSRQRYAISARDARIAMMGEEVGASPDVLDMQGAGRYVDVFEQRGGRWKIARRTCIYEGIWASPAPDLPRLNENWALARRDRTDPLYRELEAAGL
jgi:hypothetical protein